MRHFIATGEYPRLNKLVELEGLHQDGRNISIELTISYIKVASGFEFNALVQDIRKRKQAEEQLKRNAHYDLLTNLPNRALLANRLSQAMLQSQRSKQSLAVAYLDLDGFKIINDTYGHHVGDELLVVVS